MRASLIREQDRLMLVRQRNFRVAADVVTESWVSFPEIAAVAVIGSVAGPLWKEVPRFSDFRRARIEVWHECGDLDLALWLDSQDRLHDLRRAANLALRSAYESGVGISVANHEVDVFLFEPGSNRYLGRLCEFNRCPKGKPDCLVPGCGTIPFNKKVEGFRIYADILDSVEASMLYQRGRGRIRSALDLPPTLEE